MPRAGQRVGHRVGVGQQAVGVRQILVAGPAPLHRVAPECLVRGIAAIVAERSDADEAALDAYGRNLGIAFQLVDDAIDYVSDAGTMGKDAGDDFREGKMTLPVILAYARGGDEERAFWRDAVEGRRASDADFAHAIDLVRRTRAVDDTLARARHYGQRAIDALGGSSNGTAKAALVEAVEFAVARAY